MLINHASIETIGYLQSTTTFGIMLGKDDIFLGRTTFDLLLFEGKRRLQAHHDGNQERIAAGTIPIKRA